VPRHKKLFFWTDFQKIIHKKITRANPDLVLIYSKDIPYEVLEDISTFFKTAIFYPDVIKKILKHLNLWNVKPKPRPTSNGPPIDVFPAYGEQPGPITDDYIRDPGYTLQRPIFKNHTRAVRLPVPKIPTFQPV